MSARQYEILGVLGRGGFGTVYKARYVGEAEFEKLVAVKLLNTNMAEVEELGQRLRDEARVLGQLRHRAIVGVDRLARLDGHWAVVMEYVEGVSLEQALKRRSLDIGPALEIAAELASALHVAATTPGPDGSPLALQHRDLKPANVQLTVHGEVKLLDFGIARAEFGSREAQTRALFFGTPEYMAPERFREIDVLAGDIWSLGGILAEMVSGGRASVNTGSKRQHSAVMEELFERLAERAVPETLAALLGRIMAFDPDERPDAGSLARELSELRRSFADETLQTWCSREIPTLAVELRPAKTDEMVGRVIQESQITGSAGIPRLSAPPGPPPQAPSEALAPLVAPPTPAPDPEPVSRAPRRRSGWLQWALLGLGMVLLCGVPPVVAIHQLTAVDDGASSGAAGASADEVGGVRPPSEEGVSVPEEEPEAELVAKAALLGSGTAEGGTADAELERPEEQTAREVTPAPPPETKPKASKPTNSKQLAGGSSADQARARGSASTSSAQDSCVSVGLSDSTLTVSLDPTAPGGRERELPARFPAGEYAVKILVPGATRATKAGDVTLVCGHNVVANCDPVWKACTFE